MKVAIFLESIHMLFMDFWCSFVSGCIVSWVGLIGRFFPSCIGTLFNNLQLCRECELHAMPWVYEHCVVIAIANASVYIVGGLQIMIIRNYERISQGIAHGVLHYTDEI